MGYEKLDFTQLRGWLSSFKTEEEVIDAREKFLSEHKNLSDKQIGAFQRLCAERIDQIDIGIDSYFEDKEYAKKQGWRF